MNIIFPDTNDIDAWEVFLWNLPEDVVSRPQKLQLMLVVNAAFNAFDPFPVVRDLLTNRQLWQGVVMDRGYLDPRDNEHRFAKLSTDLIKLRDVSGHWNVDTLFILAEESHVAALQTLAQAWNADNIDVLSGEQSDGLLGIGRADHPERIISVWWD